MYVKVRSYNSSTSVDTVQVTMATLMSVSTDEHLASSILPIRGVQAVGMGQRQGNGLLDSQEKEKSSASAANRH